MPLNCKIKNQQTNLKSNETFVVRKSYSNLNLCSSTEDLDKIVVIFPTASQRCLNSPKQPRKPNKKWNKSYDVLQRELNSLKNLNKVFVEIQLQSSEIKRFEKSISFTKRNK